MRIGMLGSGLMGGKLGKIFARAGDEVTFSMPAIRRSSRRWRVMPARMRAWVHRARLRRMPTRSCSPCIGRESETC